jgi:hypothetical protein
LLLQTLSGNGSRTVLTAGTADEETYAEEDRKESGNSIFTKTLLKAFDSRSISDSSGFITINDLFADVQREMASFRAASGKPTTPRMWSLQTLDYRGTFVFLNLRISAARLTKEQAKALKIDAKSENTDPTVSGSGTIQVLAANPGELYIDGRDIGFMLAGQTLEFKQESSGLHNLEIRSNTTKEAKQATVNSGSIVHISFGLKPPIDETGAVPVGTLEVGSLHGVSGDVFLDDYLVGHLKESGTLEIHNIVTGRHVYRVEGESISEGGPVDITPFGILYVIPAPSPPSNVVATPQ